VLAYLDMTSFGCILSATCYLPPFLAQTKEQAIPWRDVDLSATPSYVPPIRLPYPCQFLLESATSPLMFIHVPNNQTSLHHTIQDNLQSWEILLYEVGGKLEMSKCCVVPFGPGQSQSPKSTNRVSITDHEAHTIIALTQASITASYKILGVNNAFDGNSSAQSTIFRQECEKQLHRIK
jgi:hypothetical protein